jgi:uncharacterized protein YigA (DUF484 family)
MNQPGIDIIQRLRWVSVHGTQADARAAMDAAIEEIERLRAQITHLSNSITGTMQVAAENIRLQSELGIIKARLNEHERKS